MSVSNYIQSCKYLLEELDDVVFLFNESHRKYIHIDNGEAYIDELTTQPLALEAHDINVTEEDSLDERYAFTHSVSFTVHGYANINTLDSRYYAVLKSKTNNYFVLNPEFPCTVRYTYTLDDEVSQTVFNLGTVSNHPILPLHWSGEFDKVCRYFNDSFKGLSLNEKINTVRNGEQITYVNDGFKRIDFNNGSASYVEEFDGNNLQTTLNFSINLDDYKRTWHYNLLEFLNNRYAAVIKTKNGDSILAGFNFGFEPSFALNGDSNNHSVISLSLVEMVSGIGLIGRYVYGDPSYSQDTSTAWIYTDEHDGYQCQEGGIAKYLLQKEINAFGNPTGRYKALQGYEDMFPSLNIVGTFTEVMVFPSDKCGDIDGGGMTGGTLTDEITVPKGQCKSFTFSAVCDWNITQVDSGLTITPMSGVAGRLYEIQVCNEVGDGSGCTVVLDNENPTIYFQPTTEAIDGKTYLFYRGNVTVMATSTCTIYGSAGGGITDNDCCYGVSESVSVGDVQSNGKVPITFRYSVQVGDIDTCGNSDCWESDLGVHNFIIHDENGNVVKVVPVTITVDGQDSHGTNPGGGIGGPE